MEASRRFYETLGLTFIDHRPSGKGIDLTDGTLNMTIIQYDGEERQPLEEGTEFVHFGLIVADLECTYKTLQERSARLLRDDVKVWDDIVRNHLRLDLSRLPIQMAMSWTSLVQKMNGGALQARSVSSGVVESRSKLGFSVLPLSDTTRRFRAKIVVGAAFPKVGINLA